VSVHVCPCLHVCVNDDFFFVYFFLDVYVCVCPYACVCVCVCVGGVCECVYNKILQ